MIRRLAKLLVRCAAVLAVAWLVFVAAAYHAMSRGPDAIGSFMAAVPGPLYMVMPFETLWNRTRAGPLAVGDVAPDFELPTLDGSARVRLSSFRGKRPVVLVFGSYT